MIPLLVSNTGPLIALSSIDQVGLLSKLAMCVRVASAVQEEICFSTCKQGADVFGKNPWIEISPPPSNPPDPWLTLELDRGEAATIALAVSLKANLVLIDERKGRRVASMIYQLDVIGTGGILLLAKRQGLIQAVKPLLLEIKASGYFLSQKLIDGISRSAGEF